LGLMLDSTAAVAPTQPNATTAGSVFWTLCPSLFAGIWYTMEIRDLKKNASGPFCPDEHPHRIAAFVALTHRPKQIQGRTEGFSRASTVRPSSIFFPFQINHFPGIACSRGLLSSKQVRVARAAYSVFTRTNPRFLRSL
jgi:hypothetical protein